MSTLTDIKTALRISHSVLDDEIQTDINAAKQRMRMKGVRIIDEDEALTKNALKLHAKASFNFQGDGERYAAAFERLTDAMCLCGEYNGDGGGCCHE